MATKNPRLNVVLELPLYQNVRRLAEKDGVSLSLKARDLIRLALEYCEDAYWVKTIEKREESFGKKKSLTHKEIWA